MTEILIRSGFAGPQAAKAREEAAARAKAKPDPLAPTLAPDRGAVTDGDFSKPPESGSQTTSIG